MIGYIKFNLNENKQLWDTDLQGDFPNNIVYLDINKKHNMNSILTFFNLILLNLKILDIGNNNLTSFDPEYLPNLEILDLYNNNLREFNPKNLPNLITLNISDIDLTLTTPNIVSTHNNILTSFDPDNLPKLKELNLTFYQ